MEVEIRIDRDLCIGSGNCCAAVPRVFELDVVGLAVVANPNGDCKENILRAAAECPTQAIRILENQERIT